MAQFFKSDDKSVIIRMEFEPNRPIAKDSLIILRDRDEWHFVGLTARSKVPLIWQCGYDSLDDVVAELKKMGEIPIIKGSSITIKRNGQCRFCGGTKLLQLFSQTVPCDQCS